MSIKFTVVERGEPGVTGGGTKKFYANTKTVGEMDIDQLTKSIEKISTVSGADIRAVLYALVDVSIDGLSNGYIVRMGDLGNFRVSLSSNGLDTTEAVTANAIKSTRVLFAPGKRIKDMQKTLSFQKVKQDGPAPVL